jgi:hypothetical protein
MVLRMCAVAWRVELGAPVVYGDGGREDDGGEDSGGKHGGGGSDTNDNKDDGHIPPGK